MGGDHWQFGGMQLLSTQLVLAIYQNTKSLFNIIATNRSLITTMTKEVATRAERTRQNEEIDERRSVQQAQLNFATKDRHSGFH